MMNMQNMMKQAQKLQKQMEQSQAELAATQFVGKSAQDLVVATLTGDKKVVSIDFNAAVVDPEDTCLLYTSPSPRDRSVSRMPSSA